MGSGHDCHIDCLSRLLSVPLGYEAAELRWYNVRFPSVDVVTSTLAVGISTRCGEADSLSMGNRPSELAGRTLYGVGKLSHVESLDSDMDLESDALVGDQSDESVVVVS